MHPSPTVADIVSHFSFQGSQKVVRNGLCWGEYNLSEDMAAEENTCTALSRLLHMIHVMVALV